MPSVNAVLSRLYGRGLAPKLVLDLDAAMVVFELDDLHLIPVSCAPIPWSSGTWTILGMWLDMTIRIFLVLKIWLFVLNAKQLLFRKRTCVGLLFVACVKLSWFWRALIPIFPFRENRSSSSALFGLNFGVLRNPHTLKFLVKPLFPMLWWLVLNSSVKSALRFHFSLLG